MSGSEDYSTWRLQTNGGIKYRFLGSSGSFDRENGEIEWQAVIRSEDLYEVLQELFPPPIVMTGLAYPNAGTMPGFPSMICKRITYKNHIEGIPVDPYEFDVTAPIGTYSSYLVITIIFGPSVAKASDPVDPRTFLEVSCSADGEFIYIPATDTKVQDEESSVSPNDEVVGEGAIEAGTGLTVGTRVSAEKRPNRSPILPSSVMVPTLKWSIKWKQIPAVHFRDVVIHRLRLMLGRVNSVSCGFLYDAAPETLLFLGFNHTESYSWRLSNVETPPIDVDIQILEKRVIHRGVICGHNHVFEPGNGWVRQWIGPTWTESLYRSIDMNFLFQV